MRDALKSNKTFIINITNQNQISMRKATSLLMLLLLAITGNVTAFAQDGDVTIEYEAFPGWVGNDRASILWAGFTTPGTEDKSYMMSAFQFAQCSGYGAADRYTAIASVAPTGAGATLDANDVLAVSTNSVLPTNADNTTQYYLYNLSEPIELIGGTTYYMVFITSNVPDDNNKYTVASQRIRLNYNVYEYPAQVMNANGQIPSKWVPGFKATLTVSKEEAAEIQLQQLVNDLAFDATAYAVDIPGGYPQQKIDDCQEAYDQASDLLLMGGTYDDYVNAKEALQNAFDALKASLIPVVVTPGYYYVVSARPTPSGNAVVSVDDLDLASAVAMKTNNDGDRLVYGEGLNTTLDGVNAEPAFIWKLEAAEDGMFIFNNLLYGRYIDDNGARAAYYGFTASATEAARFAAETSINVPGTIYLRQASQPESEGYNSLAVSPSYGAVVNWLPEGVSSWLLVPVTQETVDALGDKIADIQAAAAQAALNDTLRKYLIAGVDAREAGRAFIFDGTNDGQFVKGDGLITSADQLWSNAKDPSEGTYEGLLDIHYRDNSGAGITGTFFHTSWHQNAPSTEIHYLQMDLGTAVKDLVLKYGVRSDAGSNDIPYGITVYGTNDAALTVHTATTGTPGEDGYVAGDTISCSEWVNLGDFTLTYPYTLVDSLGQTVTNAGRRTSAPVVMGAGVTTLELPAAYRYIRLAVNTTIQSVVTGKLRTNGDGFNYWNLSSLRAYSGQFDPDCVYANMDETVKTNLENSLKAATQELADEKATQETVDALKAAIEAFLAVFPDANKLKAAIEEAESWVAPAIEGSELGNYNPGTINGYQAIIDGAKDVANAKPLTYSNYQNVLQTIDLAKSVLNANLVTPETGYYNIQSLTTGAAKESFLNARSTSTTSNRANNGLAWNYAGMNVAELLNTVWYVEKLDNGKFTFKNMATGYYMDNKQTSLSGGIAQVAEPVEIALRSARDTSGIGFNFIMNDEGTLFGNADPSAGFVVWNSGKGNDNSAWSFLSVSSPETMIGIFPKKPVEIHTLPFDILCPTVSPDVCEYFTVAGLNQGGTDVVLTPITEGTVIAGGTPFIIKADTSSVKDIPVFLKEENVENIVYVRQALTVNALIGTFEPDTVTNKELVMDAKCEKLTYAATAAQQIIAANSGYFSWSALQELPRIDGFQYSIPLVDDLVNGIEDIVIAEPVAPSRQGVYTLQGQKLSGTRNLPAGVYIINGRKVLVK